MNARRITRELSEKVFDQAHMEVLQCVYAEDIEEDDLIGTTEKEYDKAKVYLGAHLTDEQKNVLKSVELCYEKNRAYAGRYPFICGIVHAFEQFFPAGEEYRFNFGKAVMDGMCSNPGMQRHFDFYTNATEALAALESLGIDADEEIGEHITSIVCAWDQRIHSATMHAFYLGYQAGLSMIEDVQPMSTMYMVKDTLYLEYELGLKDLYSMRRNKTNGQKRAAKQILHLSKLGVVCYTCTENGTTWRVK